MYAAVIISNSDRNLIYHYGRLGITNGVIYYFQQNGLKVKILHSVLKGHFRKILRDKNCHSIATLDHHKRDRFMLTDSSPLQNQDLLNLIGNHLKQGEWWMVGCWSLPDKCREGEVLPLSYVAMENKRVYGCRDDFDPNKVGYTSIPKDLHCRILISLEILVGLTN